MNQQLRDAIKEVAEYDGWVQKDAEDLSWWWRDYHFRESIEEFGYHTSADALLPVYNKLSKLMTNEDLYINWLEAGDCILKMNLPEAVIKLGGIIQQLKQVR